MDEEEVTFKPLLSLDMAFGGLLGLNKFATETINSPTILEFVSEAQLGLMRICPNGEEIEYMQDELQATCLQLMHRIPVFCNADYTGRFKVVKL